MDVRDESRPKNGDYDFDYSLEMPSAVNARLFLFEPSFKDGEGYGHVYNGEEFQLFYNPEEIDKDVDYEYKEKWREYSFASGRTYKSRGHLFLPKGIIVRGHFEVPSDSNVNYTTKVYRNLTSDQFFDYIAERIVASGK